MDQIKKYQEWLEYLQYGLYNEDSAFLKFAILWLSFNAYLNEIYSGIKGDYEKVKAFGESTKAIEVFQSNNNLDEVINQFMTTKVSGRRYVEDLKSGNDDYRKYFTSEKNTFMDYMKVIYQIRCNFFHGDKIPYDPEDEKLVKWAYVFFLKFWSNYLES